MFYEKITQLNQAIIECLNESNEKKILEIFVEAGISLLDADFGFVWFSSYQSDIFELVYNSPKTPYTPKTPHKDGRNYRVIKNLTPDYVEKIEKRSDKYDVSHYMKSFVIIPISYRDKIYGNIVFCFKKEELFHKEKKILCECIGTSVAQAITIHRLMKSEQEKIKTEFIADATHELRTPLAIIKGNVELALQENMEKKQTKSSASSLETFKTINTEINHMSDLVSDLALLVSSKGPKAGTSAERRKVASHEVELDKIVEQAAKRCKALTRAKKISIKVSKLPHEKITGDGPYLEKLFINIIKNAILYGKKNGSINISGSTKNNFVTIEVQDNGIGISKKDMPHVFDRFYRGEKARMENHDGSGLGLSIVTWIAEAHGGKVSVKSVENKGSTFTVSLPCSSAYSSG